MSIIAMEFSTLSMLIAGIALFLFGMMFFEETIHAALGNSIKTTIQRYAGGLVRSIGIGTVATAILQSSTVVTMIMLGFIGADILTLTQGIGVVLGANIGTTLTPWLIALIGFKLDIHAMTLPIIALGGILLIGGSRFPKLVTIAKFLLGFGLLFLGLSYMKESVDILSATFVLGEGSLNLRQSILTGLIITMVLQTSTGTSVMVLAALSGGMITFDIALGMMIGANVGTSITTFMVSFLSMSGKHHTKKIVALSHVIFNVLTATVVILAFKPIHLFLDYTGLSQDPIVGIAAFHTLFSVLGVILFGFFVPKYIAFIHRHKRDDQKEQHLFFIEQVATNLPEEYIVAMRHDVEELGLGVVKMLQSMTHNENLDELVTDKYTHIKESCEDWISKVLRYDLASATPDQQKMIESYQISVIEILNAIKQLKDIALHYYSLRESSSKAIHHYMDQFDDKLNHLAEIVEFVLKHGRVAGQEKLSQGEHIMVLDDARFLKDIRSSIATFQDDTENNHYRSQLIKTNRSVILVNKCCLDALNAYLQVEEF